MPKCIGIALGQERGSHGCPPQDRPPDQRTDRQWFVKEQLEEVSSMDQLLRVVQRAGEANLLRVEEYLAREKSHGTALVPQEENRSRLTK